MKDWFKDWFNSPYYHLLYKNRDDKEARSFMDALLQKLNMKEGSCILDLACGKGRHSKYLNEKGFDVTGVDLAKESICCALPFENENLHFYVHDMRHNFRINYYDAVFNLYTSMGYFDDAKDNIKVLKAANMGLKEKGILVIDFFNANKVIANLLAQETKELDGIVFTIRKRVEGGIIKKSIQVKNKEIVQEYEEKVQALTLKDFKEYFSSSGFELEQVYGSYLLEDFNEKKSDRLILIARKKQHYDKL
jgi:SAM-dependent methyltransferase